MKTKYIFLTGLIVCVIPLIAQSATIKTDNNIQNVEIKGDQIILTTGQKSKTPVKSSRNSDDDQDDFVVDSRDDEDDNLDDDDAGTDALQESQNSQQSFINACNDMHGTLSQSNKKCTLYSTQDKIEFNKIGTFFDNVRKIAKDNNNTCEKSAHYNGKKEWEIMCTDGDFTGTLAIFILDILCPDGQIFDSGKCVTVDSADAQPEQPADSAGTTAPAEENPKSEPATQADAPVAAESVASAETNPAPVPSGTQTSASRLKSVPENAEQCKEDIRIDVMEIVEGQSPKTKLIPSEDFSHIREQYKKYEKQQKDGDLNTTAESYLKNQMVKIYCDGVGDSNTAKNDAESAKTGNDDASNACSQEIKLDQFANETVKCIEDGYRKVEQICVCKKHQGYVKTKPHIITCTDNNKEYDFKFKEIQETTDTKIFRECNPDEAKWADAYKNDKLINELKADVNEVVAAFNEKKKTLK